MQKNSDLIIIGAGPAGMTAAIYASRAGLDTVLLDGGAPGGKLLKTNEISNWPGIKSETGADLAMDMFEHSTSFGAHYQFGEVVSLQLEKSPAPFLVRLSDGSTLSSRAVIVATGTKERLLNIPGEQENIGRGVSYCAVCDGAFYRNCHVAVIGAGNSALEEADYLTQFADQVTIIMRRDVFRAHQIAIDKVKNNPKIQIIQKAVPVRIEDDGSRVTGLRIQFTETKEERLLDLQGIFPYIGADPVTGFLKDLQEKNPKESDTTDSGVTALLDKNGYLLVDDHMRTVIPRLYGAGDVTDKVLRQVVTAAGDGAVAAQEAVSHLH